MLTFVSPQAGQARSRVAGVHHRRRRLPTVTAAVLLVAVALLLTPPAAAQWAQGTPKFDEVFAANLNTLEEQVLSGEYVVQQLNPAKFMLDADTYACVSGLAT